MNKKLATFLVFVLAINISVKAQGFSFYTYYDDTHRNGFLTNWDAIQDTNGFLYFAVGNGIDLFDGRKWENKHIGESGRGTNFLLSKANTLFVSGDTDFGTLEIDSLNRIYFSSLIEKYDEDSLMFAPHFSSLEFQSSNYFFNTKRLEVFKGDSLLRFVPEESETVHQLFELNGELYTSNANGIKIWKQDSLHKINVQNTVYPDTSTFALKIEDRVLIGFWRELPQWFDGTSFSEFSVENPDQLLSAVPYDAVQINDSTIVIAGAYGGVFFYTLHGRLLKVFDVYAKEKISGVYDLFLDHEKNLWLGTSEYIYKLIVDNPLLKYEENEGVDFFVNNLVIGDSLIWYKDTLGKLYVSYMTENNILNFKGYGETGDIYKWEDEVLIFDGESVRFSDGKKLLEVNLRTFIKNYDAPNELLMLDEAHLITINNGVVRKDSIELTPYFTKGIKYRGEIYLVSNTDGIVKVDSSLNVLKLTSPVHTNVFYNDLELINGQLYVATDASMEKGLVFGMYRINTDTDSLEEATFFKDLDRELIEKQVMELEQCPNGDIWVKSAFKTSRIRKNKDNWEISTSPYNLIGERDAIYTIACDGDEVWFGGVKGIYHLTDPDWEYTSEFKTNITGIFVNQDSLIYGGFGEPIKPIFLPYKDNQLRFTYAAASFVDETRNTYSVMLEGFDSDWSEWRQETQKDYTNIPEGNYVFRVRSKNVYDVAGQSDQIIFRILPPWYRTWWAYLVYLIFAGTLLYVVFKIRVNQLLKVERMRTKIASDLHDEVSATLTGISYFAEAVKKDKDPARKDHFIALITESAGDAKEKITDIVWSITPENDDWGTFLAKCRRYASDLLESRDLNYELKIDEHVPGKLTMNVRQHLWMMFKEMLTNAVRHAGAKRVDVIMGVEKHTFRIIVQDDGEGFTISTKSFGNGLKNIQKRAEAIGATIELDSEPSMGTRWRLELSLKTT